MRDGVPLIHFEGVAPSWYFARWPVVIVGDDPQGLAAHRGHDDTAAPGVPLNSQLSARPTTPT